jgi:hypothetical protein
MNARQRDWTANPQGMAHDLIAARHDSNAIPLPAANRLGAAHRETTEPPAAVVGDALPSITAGRPRGHDKRTQKRWAELWVRARTCVRKRPDQLVRRHSGRRLPHRPQVHGSRAGAKHAARWHRLVDYQRSGRNDSGWWRHWSGADVISALLGDVAWRVDPERAGLLRDSI